MHGGILSQNDLHFIFHCGFWWIFVLRFANPFRIPNATPTSPRVQISFHLTLILSHLLPVFSQQIQGFGSKNRHSCAFFVGCVLFVCEMKQRQKTRKTKMIQFYVCYMVTVTSKKVAFSRKQGTTIDIYVYSIHNTHWPKWFLFQTYWGWFKRHQTWDVQLRKYW